MSAESLRNLQTWLVCSTIGTALKPDVATVRDWIDSLAALASSPTQATGALSEPLDEVVERAAFVADAKRRGWTPGEFMLGAYAGWLAAKEANHD